MEKSLETIKAELDTKFSGSVYSANSVKVRKSGRYSTWRLEFSEVGGKRREDLDGNIRYDHETGVTSSL